MKAERQIRGAGSLIYRQGIGRARPFAMWQEVWLFAIGAMFWIDASQGASGFSESAYGRAAFVMPAEFWAAVMMGGSAMCILGLIKPVRRWMVQVGSAVHVAQFSFLAYSAVYTGGEFVVGLFASVFFVTAHIWLFAEATGHDV